MRHVTLSSALFFATLATLSVSHVGTAHAQVVSGDTLAAVIETGDVFVVSDGGDFTDATPFASVAPDLAYTLCIRPDGQVLVVSINASGEGGSVYDITSGTPSVFATGFTRPVSIACGGPEIVVTDVDRGIFDITAGGDFADATPDVTGLTPVGLFLSSTGTSWATHNDVGGVGNVNFGIFDVTDGGDFTNDLPFARSADGFLGSIVGHGGNLLVAEFGFGRVTNFTDGGDLSDAPNFANLSGVYGLVSAASTLYAGTDTGEVYDISAGGDFSSTPPFTTGLGGIVFGMAYYGCGDGQPIAPEQCDTAGESVSCNADCTNVVCGDGVINTTAGETCEEGGDETATCDDNCTAVMCGDGDLNPTAGEVCDDGNLDNGDGCDDQCQPEEAAGAGTGGQGGDGAANAVTSGIGGDGEFGFSCSVGLGCSVGGNPEKSSNWPLAAWLGLGLIASRRRLGSA